MFPGSTIGKSRPAPAAMLPRRHLCGYPVHLVNKFPLVLIPANANPEKTPPVFQFEDDHLKSTPGLDAGLPPYVHPLDLRDGDPAFMPSVCEDDGILCDDELAVPDEIEQEDHQRHQDKKDDHIDQWIAEHVLEFLLHEVSANPTVQYQRHQINQCLLVIEVELVFERFLLTGHLLTCEIQNALSKYPSRFRPAETPSDLSHRTQRGRLTEEPLQNGKQSYTGFTLRNHDCRTCSFH